jgi:hypothetical protein
MDMKLIKTPKAHSSHSARFEALTARESGFIHSKRPNSQKLWLNLASLAGISASLSGCGQLPGGGGGGGGVSADPLASLDRSVCDLPRALVMESADDNYLGAFNFSGPPGKYCTPEDSGSNLRFSSQEDELERKLSSRAVTYESACYDSEGNTWDPGSFDNCIDLSEFVTDSILTVCGPEGAGVSMGITAGDGVIFDSQIVGGNGNDHFNFEVLSDKEIHLFGGPGRDQFSLNGTVEEQYYCTTVVPFVIHDFKPEEDCLRLAAVEIYGGSETTYDFSAYSAQRDGTTVTISRSIKYYDPISSGYPATGTQLPVLILKNFSTTATSITMSEGCSSDTGPTVRGTIPIL